MSLLAFRAAHGLAIVLLATCTASSRLRRGEEPTHPSSKVGTDWLVRTNDLVSPSDLAATQPADEAREAFFLLTHTGRSQLLGLRSPWADALFVQGVATTGWLPSEPPIVFSRAAQGNDVNAELLWSALREAAAGRVAGVRFARTAQAQPQCWEDGGVFVLALPDSPAARQLVDLHAEFLARALAAVRQPAAIDAPTTSLPEPSATLLHRLQNWDGPSWPGDHKTLLGRMELERGPQVLAALRDAVSAGGELVDWAATSLFVLGCTSDFHGRPDLINRVADGIPEVLHSPMRRQTFCDALLDLESSTNRMRERLAARGAVDSELAEALYGLWIARTRDVAGGPWRLDADDSPRWSTAAATQIMAGNNVEAALEWLRRHHSRTVPARLMHLRGQVSRRQLDELLQHWSQHGCATALLWLAESGHEASCAELFEPLRSGCHAATLNMDANMVEVAWRSGSMPALLRRAVDLGGYMRRSSRSWLANDAALDCADAAYGITIRRLTAAPYGWAYSKLARTWCWVDG
jgi:hypothetical protein